MLINPAVIALIAASFLVGVFTLYACGVGLRIIWQWDLDSAGEDQLQLERKTYLVSSILSHVLVIELDDGKANCLTQWLASKSPQ